MRKRVLATASYILLAAIAYYFIFELPFLFPPTRLVESDSYIFGFNNSVSIISTVFFISVFSVQTFIFIRTGILSAKTLNLILPSFTNNSKYLPTVKPVSKKTYIIFALLYSITTIIFFLIVQSSRYGDATYFFSRIDLILSGREPYRDFEFTYGPALIYLPAYFAKILETFGFSVELSISGGYYIFYGLVNLLGLYLLLYLVNNANIEKYRTLIFSVLALANFGLCMCLQGTLIRFLLPYASLVFIHNFITPTISSNIKKAIIHLVLISITSSIIVLAISPEIGTAYYFCLALYTAYLCFAYKRKFRLNLVLYCILVPALLLIFFQNYVKYSTLYSVGSGGYNFPVVPAPYILIYLFSIFFIVPVQLNLLLIEKNKNSPLICGIATLNVLLIPGALGRCDPGHVLSYGFGLFLLTLVSLSKLPAIYFRGYAIVFSILFIAVSQLSTVNFIADKLPKIELIAVRHASAVLGEKGTLQVASGLGLAPNQFKPIEKLPDKTVNSSNFSRLDKYSKISIPLGIHSISPEMEKYLKSQRKFVPDYYPDNINIITEERLVRKIRDLKNTPLILIPKGAFAKLNSNQNLDDDNKRKALSMLFLYPFNYERKQDEFNPSKELLKYLSANYRKIDEVKSYELMQRTN